MEPTGWQAWHVLLVGILCTALGVAGASYALIGGAIKPTVVDDKRLVSEVEQLQSEVDSLRREAENLHDQNVASSAALDDAERKAAELSKRLNEAPDVTPYRDAVIAILSEMGLKSKEMSDPERLDMMKKLVARLGRSTGKSDQNAQSNDGWTFQNIGFRSGTSTSQRIIGEVINNTGRSYELAQFTVSVYDANGLLLETSHFYVENVPRGQTRSFDTYVEIARLPSNAHCRFYFKSGH